jgi:hypothetical protein
MQKTVEKLVTRKIKDETLWHVPYICNNMPTNLFSPHKPIQSTQTTMHRDFRYTGSSKKQEVTIEHF